MDLQLNYTHNHWMIFNEAANLLDNEYVDFDNVPQAGRWIRRRVRFNTLLKTNKSK